MEALDVVCKYFKAEFGDKEVAQLRKTLKSYQNRISYLNRKLKDIERKNNLLNLRIFMLTLEVSLRRPT